MDEKCFRVDGMSCAACSAAVEKAVKRLPEVDEAEVNLITGKMRVHYDETKIKPEDIINKIEKAGFTADLIPDRNLVNEELENDEAGETAEELLETDPKEKQSLTIPAVLAAALLLLTIAMGPMLIPGFPLPNLMSPHEHPMVYGSIQLLLSGTILWLGRDYLIKGLKALYYRNPNMESLVFLGVGAAFMYSVYSLVRLRTDHHAIHDLYFESSGLVLAFIMLGKHLENNSRRKTNRAVKELISLQPEEAWVLEGDVLLKKPSKKLKKGDRILIKPGERVPLDAQVLSGESSVDESMMTGESIPVIKAQGSELMAGTLNQQGALEAVVIRIGEELTLRKIIRFVEDAQNKKAPIANLANQISGVFVPIVMGIAFLSFCVWMILTGDLGFSLRIMVSVLVVACPCAMGLATPTAMIVGMGRGARQGILIKNGEALQTMAEVQTVVFDKTGTVTIGKPKLIESVSLFQDQEELMRLAATAELKASHPLAQAILHAAEDQGIQPSTDEIKSFINYPGKGVQVLLSDGRNLLVGNERLMTENQVPMMHLEIEAIKAESLDGSIAYVAVNGVLQGFLRIADPINESALKAMKELKRQGIHTVLLSGDTRQTVHKVKESLEMDECFAQVPPTDKAEIINGFQKKGQKVLMVGDGINDSPALAQADVGCAIGTGSDIAIEAADLVLMRADLNGVCDAIRLSKHTIRNIKQNLFWAFFYNLLCLPIAAGVFYPAFGLLFNPMLAGLAMSLSSLFVVGNALRIRRMR